MFFPFEATPMVVSGRFGSYDGSSSSSSANGHATGSKASSAFANGNHDDDFDTNNDHAHIPIWAWVLVGLGAALVAAFVLSFVFNALRERRAAHNDNRTPRYGRAALDGLKFAFFFWAFAAVAQGVRTVLGRGKKASAVTSYSKVGNDNGGSGKLNDGRSSRSSRSYNGSMAYSGAENDGDDVNEVPWSTAAYGDGGSGQHHLTGSEKYEPYSSGNIDSTSNTGTTAVSVGSTIPPYSPNSAFTSVGNSNTSGHVPAPVHITPAVSPMVTPLPTPAAVTEPLMSSMSSSEPSATYVPSHDSRPLH